VGTLEPVFDPATDMYAVGPALLPQTCTVTPTAADAGATITVDGAPVASGSPSPVIDLPLGVTPVMVVVTAEDGTTERTYTVVLERAPPAAQDAYVKASNTGSFDLFSGSGTSPTGVELRGAVAVSGDTLVVGAPGEDGAGTGTGGDPSSNGSDSSGAVYVFVRDGGTWTQQAYVKASNTGTGDGFGRSVAIDGDTLVVGAPDEDSSATGIGGDQTNNGLSSSGAVYVFVRSGTAWSQQAYVKASNTGFLDFFGTSVALDGDTLVVGAPGEASAATGVNGIQTSNGATFAGAAYVFVRAGTVWTQQAYLKASNTEAFDAFGTSVAVSGDTVAVGAPDEESAATGIGGDQTDNSALMSGAVYVFARSGTSWAQQAYVKASNTDDADAFGTALALAGDTLAVGAPGEDGASVGVGGSQASEAAAGSGAVYVFARAGTTWTQQAYVKATNTGAGDFFGTSLGLQPDWLLVGAPGEGSSATGIDGDGGNDAAPGSGAAYLLARTGAVWTHEAYLKASNTDAGDGFGGGGALGPALVAVGADGEDSAATGLYGDETSDASLSSGAGYVFR
jgi:hypothetical protein